MNKLDTFACESCSQEFGSNSSLLRHVSHKESCKEFYGEDRFLQMRRNGNLMSKKKWKQSFKYKSNDNKTSNDKRKKRNVTSNGPYYSYVPERMRRQIEGKALIKLVHSIYDCKKKESLEEFQEFALDAVFQRCEDVTLDELFDEEYFLHVTKHLNITLFEKGARSGFFHYVYFDHFTYEDFVIENLEFEMESDFNRRLKKRRTEEEKRLIEYATLYLSRKCFKQCENIAFQHFFGKFRDMFPVIEEKDRYNYDSRLEQRDVVEFVSGYLKSEAGKNLKEKVENMISKEVVNLKEDLPMFLNQMEQQLEDVK